MSYWKTKVVPKFKKFFDKGKKKAAAEACKSFDSSKEALEKEIREKTTDLHPKVVEIYRSSTVITKKLLKEPNEPAVKENSEATQGVLQELAKAGFPGAQVLCDAGGKLGPAYLPGPIVYLFQKTSSFLVEEPLPEPTHETREIVIEGGEPSTAEETKEPEAIAESAVETTPPPPAVEEKGESSEEKKEVVPIEAKKKEIAAAAVEKAKKEEVVAPVEVKAEVVPVEAKKEVTPVVEEVAPAKEEKKEVAPIKEEKKEEIVVAAPSEAKKEEAKEVPKVEEKKETPPSVEEKK